MWSFLDRIPGLNLQVRELGFDRLVHAVQVLTDATWAAPILIHPKAENTLIAIPAPCYNELTCISVYAFGVVLTL